MAEISEPLRETINKDVCWNWNWSYDKSFHDIKELIAQLRYYTCMILNFSWRFNVTYLKIQYIVV